MKCSECGVENPAEAICCISCGISLVISTEPPTSAENQLTPSGGYVGRDQEIRELQSVLENTLSGKGGLVMLAGEPGIGKTRTAQELAAYAETQRARVLWGRCYEGQGAPIYWPWIHALRPYVVQAEPKRLQTEMGVGAANIADILPELHEKLPNLTPPSSLDLDLARFHLFDSLTTFLKTATQTQPFLLVLDDLHWADPPSLLLLEFVARELPGIRLMILGTYRDVDVARRHPLYQSLGNLVREPSFARVQLGGLNRDEVAQLVRTTSGANPSNQVVEMLHGRTEGNPLFLNEILRMVSQEEIVGNQVALDSIPEGVKEAISRRLDRVSEGCNRILGLASVIGREFDYHLLKALNEGSNEEQLQDYIDEGLESHLIEEVPGSPNRYQFIHALVQETLAEELTTSRRVRLHTRIAESLEELYGANADDHASEIVHHFANAEAGVGSEKVVHYSILAGERALTTYAWEEASAHFQRGLAIKGTSPEDPEPVRDADEAALLFGLGRAQLATLPLDRLPEALIYLERSFEYYADAEDVTNAIKVAEYPLPRTIRGRTKVDSRIERALTLVPPDSVAAGRLFPIYGLELGRFENDYARAQAAFERALSIARGAGDTGLEMRTLAARIGVDYFHLHLSDCLTRSLRVVELAGQVDDPIAKVTGHLHALQTLVHLGDRDNAEQHATAGLVLAERLNSRPWLSNVLRCVVNLHRFLGDWDRARELALRNLAVQSEWIPLLKELASLEFELGEFQQGEAHLRQMQEIMRRTTPSPGSDYADTSLVSHFAGRISDSTDHLEIAEEAAQVILSSPLANPFRIEIVRTGLALRAVQIGDSALAQEQYLALAGLPGGMRASYISADRLMGLLARTIGNLETAIVHFEDALTFCHREGWGPESAWTCHDYAEALLQRNDHSDVAHAESLIEESLTISTELGMRPLMERVTMLLEQAKSQPETVPAYPDGLTQREVEVLRLVAAGKSNPEIGEELFISARTATTHVSNILNKINAANRAEAATYATRRGLL